MTAVSVRGFLRCGSGDRLSSSRAAGLAVLSTLLLLSGPACGGGEPSAPGGETQAELSVGGRIGLEMVAEGFVHPVALVPAPGRRDRLFIVDQVGEIRIVAAGRLLDEPFLDVRDRMVKLEDHYDERGLLGLAFHPEFAGNGRFFVYYSAPLQEGAPEGFDNTSRLSEFTLSETDAGRADARSERVLLEIHQPQSNHAAGTVAFGPDGFLYASVGDGGGANDADFGHVDDWYERNRGGNAQNVEANLLGKILRIDVDGGRSGRRYGIPPDNPFADGGGLPEIYAFGLRNPYRFSFDRAGDGILLAADAGQELWEEVDRIEPGGNYGWNVREGTHCFSPGRPREPPDDCPREDSGGRPLLDPVIEFANSKQQGGLGLVVIGGYVYRGRALPDFRGRYVFGAWTTKHGQAEGRILLAAPAVEGLWPITVVERESGERHLGEYLLGFGEDGDGELYVLTSANEGPHEKTGRVSRIVPAKER